MTLRLVLRDGEQVIVNGAVLRAVGRTELRVENHAAILRGREIFKPEEADTPARALYYHTVLAYIDGTSLATHQERIIAALGSVCAAMPFAEVRAVAARFARQVASMRYYQALADCRTLMALEAEIAGAGGGEPLPATAAA
jgi:flagellar protein FlbT